MVSLRLGRSGGRRREQGPAGWRAVAAPALQLPGSSRHHAACAHVAPACPANRTRAAQLFFAKVLRSASEEDVKRLFSRFGRVYDINLFRAFQGAPTTKVRRRGRALSARLCGLAPRAPASSRRRRGHP